MPEPEAGMPVDAWCWFTPHQARTIAAATARLFPTDALGPGATEAGVVAYIDRALAGHDADLQETYRRAIDELDRAALDRSGTPFAHAAVDLQDEILHAVEDAERAQPAGSPFAQSFFETLLTHTYQGLFSDPAYGGNRGMVGWKLLGFPGIQMAYGPEEFAPDAQIVRPHVYSLADLADGRLPADTAGSAPGDGAQR